MQEKDQGGSGDLNIFSVREQYLDNVKIVVALVLSHQWEPKMEANNCK